MFNKKGFIFVLSASALIAVLLIVFLSAQSHNVLEKSNKDFTRLSFSNDFVKSFNNDLERAIRITSFRALIALEEHMAVTSSFLLEFDSLFIETFSYGTINGVSANMMEDASLQDYLNRVNSIGDRFNLVMDVVIVNVSIEHFDAWNLLVKVNASVSVIDKADKASWSFFEEYESLVPILDLRDPLYTVFTNNRLPNSIREYNKTLVEGTNVSNLIEFINASYYIESNTAPSFLQRFTNEPGPSDYGIESIVNILDIKAQDIDVFEDRVKIDYIYFNNIPMPNKLCDFQGVNDYYFILPNDTQTLQRYEVDSLTYVDCD
jgi:AAA+ ATPase superfamily predicted ATPase